MNVLRFSFCINLAMVDISIDRNNSLQIVAFKNYESDNILTVYRV